MKPTWQAIVDYLETLTLTGGDCDGEPFTVLPWERRFIRGAFSQPGDAALSVSRGNGKSAMCAGLACAVVDPKGPLHGRRRHVDVFASSFAQAGVIFADVLAFMREKYPDLDNRRIWRRADNANFAALEHKASGSRVRCLGSDPRRASGLRSALALLDEPSAWEVAKRDKMLQTIRTGLGKVPNSRLIALGTRSADATHWFSKMLAGGAGYAQQHAARPHDPIFSLRTIKRANPSLPSLPSLRERILQERDEAKRDPDALASFKALRLNLGTAEIEVAVLLDADLWESIEADVPRAGPCVWGLDLGTSQAQSCVTAFWPLSGRLETLAAFPGEPSLGERGLRDGVGSLYQKCGDRGELIQTGARAVQLAPLFAEALDRFGPPSAIAADRWRADEAADALNDAWVPGCQFVERGQGWKDGAEDVRAFRRACLEGKVHPVLSLLMRSAMSEARVILDPAGNAKLAKNSENGRRLRAKDDAAASAILAVALGVKLPAPREGGREIQAAVV